MTQQYLVFVKVRELVSHFSRSPWLTEFDSRATKQTLYFVCKKQRWPTLAEALTHARKVSEMRSKCPDYDNSDSAALRGLLALEHEGGELQHQIHGQRANDIGDRWGEQFSGLFYYYLISMHRLPVGILKQEGADVAAT